MPDTGAQLKTNSRGMTRLLVAIHESDRARLAQASRASGASQQSIIRNGICLIVENILGDPRAKIAASDHKPAPARAPRHVIDAMLDAIRGDERQHGAVARMTSTGIGHVTITFADGWKNQYATPDSTPGRAEQDVAAMNQALRAAFSAATTKLFRTGGAK